MMALCLLWLQAPSSVRVPRRALLWAAPASRHMADASSLLLDNPPFEHLTLTLPIDDLNVPVAIWRPAAASAPPPEAYLYRIDIGKIAEKLRVSWLSWLPRFDYQLPCGIVETKPNLPPARESDCIMFAHGFLGSVYDFAHAAEALAADGFTVVAPELPESLCASYVPTPTLSRERIIAATRELVGPSRRWGIFGHSAGASSALNQPGSYELGRAAFAGGARGAGGEANEDPVFICASNGDGCIRFFGAGVTDLRPLLESAVPEGKTSVLFTNLNDAYASLDLPAEYGVFVFADDNSRLPLPCHISFLWNEVNDAMASLLSPLLPLAKALGLFVLDFDVYLQNRDSKQIAEQTVPALRRFFLSSSA